MFYGYNMIIPATSPRRLTTTLNYQSRYYISRTIAFMELISPNQGSSTSKTPQRRFTTPYMGITGNTKDLWTQNTCITNPHISSFSGCPSIPVATNVFISSANASTVLLATAQVCQVLQIMTPCTNLLAEWASVEPRIPVTALIYIICHANAKHLNGLLLIK